MDNSVILVIILCGIAFFGSVLAWWAGRKTLKEGERGRDKIYARMEWHTKVSRYLLTNQPFTEELLQEGAACGIRADELEFMRRELMK